MRELLAAAKEQQLVAMENPVARPEASRGTVRPIPEASQRPNASRQNRQNPAPSRHESRVKSNRPPQPQAEEWKSLLSIAGAMTCLSNRQRDQQSAPDLALAKSVRMTQGTELSSWRRRLKKMKKEKPDHLVSVTAFGRRSSPKASRCRETPPSITVP